VTEQGLDRNASRVLAGVLRAEIEDGRYPPGSRLPSYRQLRDDHHVALNTAQAAIRMLAAEGIVDIRPAKGAYVREQTGGQAPALRTELSSLQAALHRSSQDLAAAEKRIASLLARMPAEQSE
jgi:DNA-binding FadR family transcriptional regulator